MSDAGSASPESCRGADRSDFHFQRVVEAAPSAMVMVNAAGRIELVNVQVERVFGYQRAELIGQPVEILLPQRLREHHPSLRQAFFAEPQSRPMGIGRDLFARRKDGSEFPVEIGLSPIETEEGTMVLSAIVDISERRRSEERFRLVVEAAPSAMVMINARGEIEMVNAQAERVFGYERAEMLGQAVEMLVPERLRDHHPGLRRSFAANSLARPMGAGRDLYARRRDGSEFPVEIGLNPIETEDGTKILSAIVDISDRKQKERSIEQALKEKDVLLGEIHHRVKNNLQIVHSLLDLQSSQISDPVVLAMLRDSQNRVHSMALIHQTLYQSQDFARLNFGAFLDSFVPLLISSYAIHGNKISVQIDAHEVSLPINSAIPCGLIVNELVSNALKHAFPDGRQGQILLELKPDEDGNLILSVSDDGIGLPQELDLKMAGSLGLQLVSMLGDQLRGKLDIRRRDPTRFTLHIPRPDEMRWAE
ncbi:PAS domain S-box protein [Dongia sp.]|uniref:PAS domain S-box protein n=1 Tax=Dongia sp. TaxID=1977262 RepID=UPI0035ADF0EE